MKPHISEILLKSFKNELDMLVYLHTKNKALISKRYPYKYQDYISMAHKYQDLWESITKLQKKYDLIKENK